MLLQLWIREGDFKTVFALDIVGHLTDPHSGALLHRHLALPVREISVDDDVVMVMPGIHMGVHHGLPAHAFAQLDPDLVDDHGIHVFLCKGLNQVNGG